MISRRKMFAMFATAPLAIPSAVAECTKPEEVAETVITLEPGVLGQFVQIHNALPKPLRIKPGGGVYLFHAAKQ